MQVLELVLIIAAILLVSLWLHVSIWLITRDDNREAEYLIRLFVVAVIAVFLVPILEGIGGMVGVPQIGPVIAFVALVYAVKFFLIPYLTAVEEWPTAIWITLLGVIFIIIFNFLTTRYLDLRLVPVY